MNRLSHATLLAGLLLGSLAASPALAQHPSKSSSCNQPGKSPAGLQKGSPLPSGSRGSPVLRYPTGNPFQNRLGTPRQPIKLSPSFKRSPAPRPVGRSPNPPLRRPTPPPMRRVPAPRPTVPTTNPPPTSRPTPRPTTAPIGTTSIRGILYQDHSGNTRLSTSSVQGGQTFRIETSTMNLNGQIRVTMQDVNRGNGFGVTAFRLTNVRRSGNALIVQAPNIPQLKNRTYHIAVFSYGNGNQTANAGRLTIR